MKDKPPSYAYLAPLFVALILFVCNSLKDIRPGMPVPVSTPSALFKRSSNEQPTSPVKNIPTSTPLVSRSFTILVDDFRPQPYQGMSIYAFNRLDGDRGAINNSLLEWGNGQVTTTVSSGNSWSGGWTSLNHPIREGLPINFSAILPVQILPAYQSQITGLTVRIAEGTPGKTFRIELKGGNELRWQNETVLTGEPQVANFNLPVLGNINQLVWVLDHASAGHFVVLENISFTATTQITDTVTAAFVWSYGMLLNNWNPVTGLVRDKAKDASGEFEAIQATGSLAAATVVAEQLGVVSHADALQIVNRISDTLLIELPRFHGLWPHWVKSSPAGGITIVENTEWSSVDTVIAAVGLLEAQNALGMGTSSTEQMLQAIDWKELILPGGVSHGYTHPGGKLIPYAWDVFGGETWLVELAYAGVTGEVAPIVQPSPPTANGSGFIDELAWLFVPPPAGQDYWGTDWASYRLAVADRQISYYSTHSTAACFTQFGLFGLSAAEVPSPWLVPQESIYQPFGLGGSFAPPNDGSELDPTIPVVVPHYSAMVASLRPQEAVEMWAWLIDEGYFSPLNNVESLMLPASPDCASNKIHWNSLKGSWNLALQTLGWGRYLAEQRGQRPILWQATTTNPLLHKGYLTLTKGNTGWTSAGLDGGNINALVIDPLTPATLYAGTVGGVLKSTNGGGDWANTSLTHTHVSSLVIDQANPSTLYAGTGSGVFKSITGGEGWNAINANLTDLNVSALVIDPATPSTLYAGTGSGVFKSTNGGESWSAANSGLNNNPLSLIPVSTLVIDSATPSTLYAGTNSYIYPGTWRYIRGAIFKSTNGGETWNQLYDGNTDFTNLAIDPAIPSSLYAGTSNQGVLKSTNGGQSWRAINTGLPHSSTSILAIDPATPATLYAGTMNGVFKSTNGGGYWSVFNTGLDNTEIRVLAINPVTPTMLYAGTSGGIFIIR